MPIPNYDTWKLDSGNERVEKVVCQCEHCEENICEGEDIYETVNGIVHEDCFLEFAKKTLEANSRYA